MSLLTAPLDAYDVVSVLSLSSYPKARVLAARSQFERRRAAWLTRHSHAQVMGVLEHNTRKQMAVTIVRCVLKSGTVVQEVEQARARPPHARAPRVRALHARCISRGCGLPG